MKQAIAEQFQVEEDLEAKKKHALEVLERLRGSIKIKRRLTKDELDKMAFDFTEEDSKKIAKKYGFRV